MPHCTPPLIPPLPTRVCQTISPFLSGSNAQTTPDFCPASHCVTSGCGGGGGDPTCTPTYVGVNPVFNTWCGVNCPEFCPASHCKATGCYPDPPACPPTSHGVMASLDG